MKKIPLVLIPLVVFLDQTTKYLADKYVHPVIPVKVLPFFHLINIRNTGSAFGMFRDWGNNIFIAISLAAVVIILFMLIKGREEPVSLSLILGGAAGNLLDRIFRGSVVDFLDFFAGRYHWPAFNVADAALTIGIGMIFIRLLVNKNEQS